MSVREVCLTVPVGVDMIWVTALTLGRRRNFRLSLRGSRIGETKTPITLVVLGWPSCRVLGIAGPSGGTLQSK